MNEYFSKKKKKYFCRKKETINQVKRERSQWGENICNIYDKVLIIRLYEEIFNLIIKRKPNRKMGGEYKQTIIEEVQTTNAP